MAVSAKLAVHETGAPVPTAKQAATLRLILEQPGAAWRDTDGGAVKRLGEALGLSVLAVSNRIARLVALGWLTHHETGIKRCTNRRCYGLYLTEAGLAALGVVPDQIAGILQQRSQLVPVEQLAPRWMRPLLELLCKAGGHFGEPGRPLRYSLAGSLAVLPARVDQLIVSARRQGWVETASAPFASIVRITPEGVIALGLPPAEVSARFTRLAQLVPLANQNQQPVLMLLLHCGGEIVDPLTKGALGYIALSLGHGKRSSSFLTLMGQLEQLGWIEIDRVIHGSTAVRITPLGLKALGLVPAQVALRSRYQGPICSPSQMRILEMADAAKGTIRCRRGIRTLAKKLDLSYNRLRTVLATLEQWGWIEKERSRSITAIHLEDAGHMSLVRYREATAFQAEALRSFAASR